MKKTGFRGAALQERLMGASHGRAMSNDSTLERTVIAQRWMRWFKLGQTSFARPPCEEEF
jgi:hypothetical protein